MRFRRVRERTAELFGASLKQNVTIEEDTSNGSSGQQHVRSNAEMPIYVGVVAAVILLVVTHVGNQEIVPHRLRRELECP